MIQTQQRALSILSGGCELITWPGPLKPAGLWPLWLCRASMKFKGQSSKEEHLDNLQWSAEGPRWCEEHVRELWAKFKKFIFFWESVIRVYQCPRKKPQFTLLWCFRCSASAKRCFFERKKSIHWMLQHCMYHFHRYTLMSGGEVRQF